MNTLVLAAGKSTRIQSVTGGSPKPLLSIRGESIIGRNLKWLAAEGITEIWINLHYRPEEIQQALGDGSQFGVQIHYILESEILGTAGAVKNIAADWEEPYLVVYGDSLVRFDLGAMVKRHQEKQPLATIALFNQTTHQHTSVARSCVKVDTGFRVLDFEERPAALTAGLVNAGVYLVEPPLVQEIPSNTFYDFGLDLFPKVLTSNKHLSGYVIDGYCLGLDTPESYAEALHLLEIGKVTLS